MKSLNHIGYPTEIRIKDLYNTSLTTYQPAGCSFSITKTDIQWLRTALHKILCIPGNNKLCVLIGGR
jgi:hypothetical protein